MGENEPERADGSDAPDGVDEGRTTAAPLIPDALRTDPSTAAAPQHAGRPQPTAPQHLGGAEPTAPQHVGGPQPAAPQHDIATHQIGARHDGSSVSGGAQQGAPRVGEVDQHDPGDLRAPDAQHEPSTLQPGEPPDTFGDAGHGLEAQHAGGGVRAGGLRGVRHLIQARPRLSMLVLAGVGLVAIGTVATVATQSDDSPPPNAQAAAASTTITSEPVATAVPVITTDSTTAPTPATIAPPVTEAVATTTSLPSGEGTYLVQLADVVLATDAGSNPGDGGDPQAWSLAGACDGVGDCVLTDADPTLDPNGNKPFSGAVGPIQLTPAGPGHYTGSYVFDFADCGNGTNTISIDLAGANISGTYSYELVGLGDCPHTTFTSSFTGTRR